MAERPNDSQFYRNRGLTDYDKTRHVNVNFFPSNKQQNHFFQSQFHLSIYCNAK